MGKEYKVEVYKSGNGPSAKLRPLAIQREWMDSGVYHCIPIATANKIGYGVYFEEDISFRLDSKNGSAYSTNTSPFVWSGKSLTNEAYGRGYGTVSFEPNLIFKTDENVSLMTMPVPNQVLENATVVSTLLSTSFFTASLPIVWKLHKENYEYFIPAGTDIAAVLPISLSNIQNCQINYYDYHFPNTIINSSTEYLNALSEKMNSDGKSGFYKKAIDHNNNKIGKHEVDKLNLFLNEKSKK